MTEMGLRWGTWHGRKYFLDKMTLDDLVGAYFTYYAIQVYLLLAIVSGGLTVQWYQAPLPILLSALAAVAVYPTVWYLLHRWILHGRILYRSPLTAGVWKRIHYDHHRDPNDLGILFGALYTTLPTLVIVTIPIGYLIGGPAGAAAAFSAALITTCFYEFCHCIQHLPFKPRYAWLKEMKKRHLAHHFHSEKGNYGITNFLPDRVLGTLYEDPKTFPRSSTVFNLGYCGEEARRYPWVAELSGMTVEEAMQGGGTPRKAAS